MAERAARERVENKWFNIAPRTFSIGIDDPEDDTKGNGFFAWDNERGPYDVSVHGFEAQARPVSIGEYATYLVKTSQTDRIPLSWTRRDAGSAYSSGEAFSNGSHGNDVDVDVQKFIDRFTIKAVFGPVPLNLALDWPVYITYNDATAYADWAGARIPTLHEARSIHRQVEEEKITADDELLVYPTSLSPFSPSPVFSI